jgi:hypothetical protein
VPGDERAGGLEADEAQPFERGTAEMRETSDHRHLPPALRDDPYDLEGRMPGEQPQQLAADVPRAAEHDDR